MDAALILNTTEEQLFRSMTNGDRSALEIIYKKYYQGLFYYAKKFVKEKGAAKDIVQESFLKIWENRDSIIIVGSVSAYLYKTVCNHSINFLKHQQVNRKHIEKHKEQIENAISYFSISTDHGQSIMIAKEMDSLVNHAIENLPEKCKNIFKLSRFKGLKNNEIATELGVSLNTVQTQISIALKKLRKTLEPVISMVD